MSAPLPRRAVQLSLALIGLTALFGLGYSMITKVSSDTIQPLGDVSDTLRSSRYPNPDKKYGSLLNQEKASGDLSETTSDLESSQSIDNKYFTLANDPNLDEMGKFEVSNLLIECHPASITNEDQLARYQESSTHIPEMVEIYKRQLEKCSSLYKMADSPQAIRELRHAWLKSAADDGLKVAEAMLMLESGQDNDSDILSVIEQSVMQDFHIDSLKFDVLFVVRKFYRDRISTRPEIASKVQSLPTDPDNAWLYLECKYDPSCDFDMLNQDMGEYFSAYEVEQVLALSDRYEEALEDGDFSALDLDPSD